MSKTPIPVQNVYYLLCYAWNNLKEGELVDVSRLPSTKLADLFAFVLIGGLKHLIRRGLEQTYVTQAEVLGGLRGRLEMADSARRLLLAHGRALCTYDELRVDSPANQIVRSTLRFLARVPELDKGLRGELLQLYRDLHGIDDIRVSALSFRKIQLHSNNRYYRFLLNVCEMVHGSWLVDERSGAYRFRDFLSDGPRMAKLFQGFVLNFYRVHRPDLKPRSEQIFWRAKASRSDALDFLPRLLTDISLQNGNRKLIIDTKYYRDTLSSYFEVEKVRSQNLFQLLAYLSNVKLNEGETVEGMLLYPVVRKELRITYDEIQGFPVRICTVNLAKDWRAIEEELLSLVA